MVRFGSFWSILCKFWTFMQNKTTKNPEKKTFSLSCATHVFLIVCSRSFFSKSLFFLAFLNTLFIVNFTRWARNFHTWWKTMKNTKVKNMTKIKKNYNSSGNFTTGHESKCPKMITPSYFWIHAFYDYLLLFF